MIERSIGATEAYRDDEGFTAPEMEPHSAGAPERADESGHVGAAANLAALAFGQAGGALAGEAIRTEIEGPAELSPPTDDSPDDGREEVGQDSTGGPGSPDEPKSPSAAYESLVARLDAAEGAIDTYLAPLRHLVHGSSAASQPPAVDDTWIAGYNELEAERDSAIQDLIELFRAHR